LKKEKKTVMTKEKTSYAGCGSAEEHTTREGKPMQKKDIQQRGNTIRSGLRKKLIPMAALVAIWAAVQPGTLSAQTSGVGCDGYTRLLWRGTDSSINLWNLDPSLNLSASVIYGPYEAWSAVAITVGCDNYTRVLWQNTDGAIDLWLVDPNLNYVSNQEYGPYSGWLAESLSIDGADNLRLIWKNTNGEIDVWMLGPALNYLTGQIYGPYWGWNGGAADTAKSGANSSTPQHAKADAAMKALSRSSPMPR
jgi:hypothetical protein